MNKSMVSRVLGLTFLLVSIFVLAGHQAVVAAQLDFDPVRTREADSARWVALGERYQKVALVDRIKEAAAEREWVAKGASLDSDAARWVAMGEHYGKLSLDSIQWVAWGELSESWIYSQPDYVVASVGLEGVDPADRKFFTNDLGYSGSQRELLTGINDVDAKLANYIYESETLPESDSLANVDPADRKFFMDEYEPFLASALHRSILLRALAME